MASSNSSTEGDLEGQVGFGSEGKGSEAPQEEQKPEHHRRKERVVRAVDVDRRKAQNWLENDYPLDKEVRASKIALKARLESCYRAYFALSSPRDIKGMRILRELANHVQKTKQTTLS